MVDNLVKDILGEAAGLPLLQFTLLRLWKSRERNRITLKAYRSLGSARQALTIAADEFYSGLIPQDQHTARRILLRLARPSAGVEVTSNRVTREALYKTGEARDQVDRVLSKLADAGLIHLTKGDTFADDQIEVSHEALIRNWPMLVGWLDEERVTLRKRVRLAEAAEQWQIHGKEPGGLMRGSILEEAQRYEDLNQLESEFVDASLEEQKRTELQERDAKYARKFRKLSIGLGLAIAIAVIAAVGFFIKKIEAERQAEKAERQAEKAERQAEEAKRQRQLSALRKTVQTSINDLDTDPEETIRLSLNVLNARNVLSALNQADRKTLEDEAADALSRAMSVSRIERLFDTHAKPGALVAYNDKGTRLAILGKVGIPNAERVEVMIWDTETDRLVHSPIGDNEEVSALAFAHGGNLLLITSDKMARIWNTDLGKLERSRPIEDKVTSVTFSADGRLLAAAQSGGSLRLWDFEGKQIRELEKSNIVAKVNNLSFS